MPGQIQINDVPSIGPVEFPSSLGFGRVFTQRMFSQRFADEHWGDAVIGPYVPITLDPASTVYHNGQMIFEGTKAYRRADGDINLFRPELNIERFNLSASRMGMPEVDPELHLEAIETLVALEHQWVPSDPGTALYIRPTMIATEKTLEVRASREYLHFIIMSPVAPYFADGFAPVSVYISHDFVRAVIGGTGEAKTPGNYAGSIAATEHALSRGYQQVLWLDAIERRYVDEVGAMNIAFVRGGDTVMTPMLSGAVLNGVTRRSLLELSSELGLKFEQERIDIHDVVSGLGSGEITEIFGMGTGAVIAPVGRLLYKDEEIVVRDGEPGPVAQRLYSALTDIYYGHTPDHRGWTRKMSVSSDSALKASGG